MHTKISDFMYGNLYTFLYTVIFCSYVALFLSHLIKFGSLPLQGMYVVITFKLLWVRSLGGILF